MIPYGRQNISLKDIYNVTKVLRSDFLTQGPIVDQFEKKISEYCEVNYSVSTNSATSALHIACLSLGLKAGDQVWTSPISFVATANAALYCGANVDFVDIELETGNVSTTELEKKLKVAYIKKTLPKIFIPVHFSGQSCDMEKIYELSKEFDFHIIEDASHALGGKYKGKPIGNCTFSDITIFSFHPVKIITTGEGGVATTNKPELNEKMVRLRSHGITNKKDYMINRAIDEIWNYQQLDLGYNYRLTDIGASLGVSQLSKVNKFVKARNVIATRYNDLLKPLALKLPLVKGMNYSSFHLYVIRVKESNTRVTQKNLFEHLLKNQIGANIHYIPIHRQPYYEAMGFKEGSFPNSERFHKEAISLPIFPGLKKRNQKLIVNVLREFFSSRLN